MIIFVILFVLIWIAHFVIMNFIVPPSQLLMMSPIKSQLAPYIIITLAIYIITLLVNMIRAVRNCQDSHTIGLYTGLSKALITIGFTLLTYYGLAKYPQLIIPFLSVSILPYATLLGEGFYVTLGSTIGYGLSDRLFSVC